MMFYGQPLTFSEKAHRYTWGGKHLPSVTTIIGRLNKPLLIQWAANCAVEALNKVVTDSILGEEVTAERWEEEMNYARKAHAMQRDDAGDVGRIVHDFACAKLEGKGRQVVLPPDDRVHRACAAFGEWYSSHKIEMRAVERFVVSKRSGYAGRVDGFGLIDGRLAVLDFKTGKGVYDEAWFQMAGYDDALTEELDCRWPDHWLIHLNKNTGECTPYVRRGPDETATAFQVWRALVTLDKALRAMPKMERAA